MPRPPIPHILATPTLTYEQRLFRLYKKTLSNELDHAVYRSEWARDRMIMRERFEANLAVQDPVLSRKLLEMGEDELRVNLHPIPYVHPKADFGVEWQRNLPVPASSLWLTPDEEVWFRDNLFYTQNPRKPTFARRVLRFCGLSTM